LREYIKSIATLFSANLIAQLVVLMGMPLLTLLYSPSQIGMLGVSISIISICAILISLRLDIYMLKVIESDLADSFKYSIQISVIQFTVIFILLLFFGSNLNEFLKVEFDTVHYLLMAITSLLTAIAFLLNSVLTRYKCFPIIAKSTVLKSICLVLFQLLLGLFNISKGLWFAELISRLAQVIFLFKKTHQKKLLLFKGELSFNKFVSGSKPFVVFSSTASLISTVNTFLPVVVLPFLLSIEAAGLYFFVTQILYTPISMLAQSVSKVFSSSFINKERNEANRLFYKTFLIIFVIALVLVLLLSLVHPWFIHYLPSKWQSINTIFNILLLNIIPILSISSLSQVFNLINKQKYLVFTECVKLFFQVSVLVYLVHISATAELDLRFIVSFIVMSSYISYSIQFVIMTYLLRKRL
jgi:O-antigen/teichoic acid export membrane protein